MPEPADPRASQASPPMPDTGWLDQALDKALADTFPASDPVALTRHG